MLARIIATLVMTFCLAAGVMASPVEQAIFANQAKSGAEFKAALKKYRVVEDGQEYLVVEDDQVYLNRLGIMVHGWAKEKGFLSEEAATDYKVFAAALVERYGEKVAIDQFTDMAAAAKLVIPAKVAPATQPKQAAVAAASAPTPAPVAVAQVPTPAVKTAPVVAKTDPEVMTRTEFLNSVKDLNKKIEGNSDARVDFYERRISQLAQGLEEKAVAGFKKKAAEALLKNEPALLAKVNERIDAKDKIRGEQISSLGNRVDQFEGRLVDNEQATNGLKKKYEGVATDVTTLGQRQTWQNVAIAIVGLLAILGLVLVAFNWWRIKQGQAKAVVDIGNAKTEAVTAAKEYTDQVNSEVGKKMAGLRANIDKLDERVEVAEGVLYKDPEWELTDEQRTQLFGMVFNLKFDETAEFELVLNEGTVLLVFKDHGDDSISIADINVRPFHKKRVCAKVTEFYHAGKLPEPLKLTPVVKLAA